MNASAIGEAFIDKKKAPHNVCRAQRPNFYLQPNYLRGFPSGARKAKLLERLTSLAPLTPLSTEDKSSFKPLSLK